MHPPRTNVVVAAGFRGETHKNDVLQLCQQRARECRAHAHMVDAENATLLWNYLQLLIKQNGVRLAIGVLRATVWQCKQWVNCFFGIVTVN